VLVIPAKVIATCFALIGFAAAIVVGVAADNDALTILWRALIVMLVAWPIGRLFGGVAQRACDESILAHKQKYPIPRDEDGLDWNASLVDAPAQDEPNETPAPGNGVVAGSSMGTP